MQRYARQLLLPEIGSEGQKKLEESSALIIGLGGLGSPVSSYLAAAGVGRLGLLDCDIVSESNLNRQILYSTADIDLPKTECALRRLSQLNPHCRFDTYNMKFDADCAEDIVDGYDLIVDCTDNFPARIVIDEACASTGKRWVHGAVEGFSGHVTVFNGSARKRYSDLFPDITADNFPPKNPGILGSTAGAIGSIMSAEAVKLLLGVGSPLDGSLLLLDLLSATTQIIDF